MPTRIAFLVHSFDDGGVERMLVNTARTLDGCGVRVDFLIDHRRHPYVDLLPASVQLIELGISRHDVRNTLTSYLAQEQPKYLISAKISDDELALDARDRAGVPVQVLLRVGNPLVNRLHQHTCNPLVRWARLRTLKRLYARADGYIAVTRGIAEELAEHLAPPGKPIYVLPNPSITDDLFSRARVEPKHPWFAKGEPPVIMGTGGLRRQKDFGTLVRAFAIVRKTLPCRLLILGKGRQRDRLLRLARRLGIADHVQLMGFQENPHTFIARAACFVTSSRWEGAANVLVEAAALGTPIVSTACPSGPSDILGNGRFGVLVPVGDASAMARAIVQVLQKPLLPEVTRQAAEPYTAERSATAYIRALKLEV
jgi:glycosyltransferase involved in cell wall biosynthesis